ncbi:MAG: FGGY-family carbohydrate kinase, partial [Chloroflexota bacterium]
GAALTEGGGVYGWLMNTLQLDPTDAEAALNERAPGVHGLTVLPLLGGERSPGYRANATATFHGMRYATTPLDIFHAALEGIALRLMPIADEILPPDGVMIGGGAAFEASPGWGQIIANALNRPIHVSAEAETTARGVSLLAKGGVSADHPPHIGEILHPNPDYAAQYRALYQEQAELYAKFYGEQ